MAITSPEKPSPEQPPATNNTEEISTFQVPTPELPRATETRRSRKGLRVLGAGAALVAAVAAGAVGARSLGGSSEAAGPANRAPVAEQPAEGSAQTPVVEGAPVVIEGGELETSNTEPDTNPEATTGTGSESESSSNETEEVTTSTESEGLAFTLDSLPGEEEALNPKNHATTIHEMLGLSEGAEIGVEPYSDDQKRAVLERYTFSSNYAETTGESEDLQNITLNLITGLEKAANMYITNGVVGNYSNEQAMKEAMESVGQPGTDINISSSWLLPEGGMIDMRTALVQERDTMNGLLSDVNDSTAYTKDGRLAKLGVGNVFRFIPVEVGEPTVGKADQDGNGNPDSFDIPVKMVVGPTGELADQYGTPRILVDTILTVEEIDPDNDHSRWTISKVQYPKEELSGH